MLRITPEQVEAFNEPAWRDLEAKIIAFVRSRSELKEPDGAFLEVASRQLIPRARANGLNTENDIARFVYLSLFFNYRSTGLDVCQRVGVPYDPAQLIRVEESLTNALAQAKRR